MTEHPSSRKRPYHHGDLRNALFQISMDLLTTEGLAAFGLREVARRAGVSISAIYRHFPDREALLAELAAEGFRMLIRAHAESGELEEPDAVKAIEQSGLVYLQFADQHPHLLKVMFGEVLARHQSFPQVAQLSMEAFAQLETLILRGQQQGVFRDGPVGEKALMCWGMVHGMAQIRMEGIVLPGVERSSLEDLARMVSDQLVEGL
ncbi:TetR/AcrR family transcriptional regulator [Deinococcus cellulosilyticus]|uniref:TetR family transcriptional regulator n=1 Tax=Deinococcus cellulosilyticus (strain DSM 18568 / NBRC 106333 / KACC 11606 / 5516J-15) TaxID=1223518 RepID=A0A511MZI1_DEIC1|nr:TetR/AcrR family transcriptional regulator [Deinococcus cellulosilyticus]GEM45587.1 TetR family transcriptional regulator [Deinococcus cellulosilyticus NBRC 106333 = KACC 11606]